MPKRIAVLAGYWSTNIGNAFFQLGGQWAMQQCFPDADVFLIGDQPGYLNVRKGNPVHALDYVKHLNIDAVVVLGPFARPEAPRIVGEMMRGQHEKGAKIIVLAAGMMQYDEETIRITRQLLTEAPPFIFTTRDTRTYEALGDLAEHAYDGIDVATFVSDLFTPVPTDLPPYVVINFDQIPEPVFTKGSAGPQTFAWEGETWSVRQPKFRTAMSYRSRAFPFLEAFIPLARKPNELGEYRILRTDHRYNPFLSRRSYRWPRSYAGDTPHSYLNIYANSRCTLSNRVHACVATASFGNPAMLFTRSPRALLLDRLGLTTIKEQPTSIDMDFLRREKQALLTWLRDAGKDFFSA